MNKASTETTQKKEKPKKGDMFMTLASYYGSHFRGRVIKDNGDELIVIRLSSEDQNGRILNDAMFFSIATKDVTKIKDWKKA